MGDSQEFCLRWSSYQQQLGEALRSLLARELLVDVTLACDGRSLRAHRTILSACSHYFQELFQESTHPHPIVILKDVKFEELEALIRFMYHGEVTMNNESLPGFLRTAETLQIRGLTGGSLSSKRFLSPQMPKKNDRELGSDAAAGAEETHQLDDADGPADSENSTEEVHSPETKRIKMELVSPPKSPPKPCQSFTSDGNAPDTQSNFTVSERGPGRSHLKSDEAHVSSDSSERDTSTKTFSLEGLSQLVLPVLQDESSSSSQFLMNQGSALGPSILPLPPPGTNNHGLVSRPFRHRVLWNHDQLLQLETWYRADRYPTGQAMRQYADTLAAMCPTGASPTRQNVDYWFQNRRRKDSHPEVMQQREKKKLAKTLWGQILDQRGQGSS